MKKSLIISFAMLTLFGSIAVGQIKPIKRSQKAKAVQTKKPQDRLSPKKNNTQSKTGSKGLKHDKSRTEVVANKHIDEIIRNLIDNMVYVQVEDLWYSPSQYNPINQFVRNSYGNARSSEPVQSFYICKYEVTQELWSAVMGYNPSSFSSKKSLQNPVENVTWEECQEFIYTLNELVREGVNLKWTPKVGQKTFGVHYV